MKLVIVESPSKAKTIAKYLGNDFKVKASAGHINDLPEKRLGIDVENHFQPEYVITEGKKKTIEELKALLSKAETVYLATDPDREGEAISWHLKTVLGIPDGTIRIEFNEISKKAVQKAITEPRELNMNLVNAQQARRVLDRLVGYKMSPVLNKKIKSGLSAGRVQSAALRMLVDREREIRNFVPEEYWTLNAMLDKEDRTFKAAFSEINGEKVKISDKPSLDSVLSAIDGKPYIVTDVKRAVKKVKPQPPFTTSTLQQDGTTKLGLSAPQVMQIAQHLYEGFEIEGEGHIALVTYIRTDSVRISDDAMWDAKRYITAKYGEEYVPQYFNKFEVKGNAQDAHEAIRPISLARTPESLKDKLSKQNYQLYKLIYDRFIASQMAYAEYDTLTVTITVDGNDNNKYGFKVSGKTTIFPGYTTVYADPNQKEDDEHVDLPNLNVNDILTLQKLLYEQKFTKPPQRYTEATLVKAMEDNGIGRPSTYASILSVLTKRTYLEHIGKHIAATQLGEAVCDTLLKYFPDILDLKFTANMEKELDTIEEGKLWYSVIEDFYPNFNERVKQAFFDGGPVKVEAEESDVVCDKCGAKMIIKEGRNGVKFLACPNYPKCKNTKSIIDNIVGKCPLCEADVTKKLTKTGKTFYGCTAYPVCKFASWDIPAPYLCPDCGKTMKVVNTGGQTKYVCTNCQHSELK